MKRYVVSYWSYFIEHYVCYAKNKRDAIKQFKECTGHTSKDIYEVEVDE